MDKNSIIENNIIYHIVGKSNLNDLLKILI